MKPMKIFTAYVEYDPETNLYVGIVPGITGAHTQAESLDELQVNLKEVLELCLEEYGNDLEDLPRFVGIQQIEVSA
jgi:predicted RNase H-like HicB family nuclease